MSSVVIIGGGIGGLASAALLARAGHAVTLLEAHSRVGGRAGNWEKDGFRFDTGPSWYLMPEVFDHFYKLLGTSAEEQLELITLDPGYRVYFEGQRRRPSTSRRTVRRTSSCSRASSESRGVASTATSIPRRARTSWPCATFSTPRSRSSAHC